MDPITFRGRCRSSYLLKKFFVALIASSSRPLQHFFERSCVACRRNDAEMGHLQLVTRFGVIQQVGNTEKNHNDDYRLRLYIFVFLWKSCKYFEKCLTTQTENRTAIVLTLILIEHVMSKREIHKQKFKIEKLKHTLIACKSQNKFQKFKKKIEIFFAIRYFMFKIKIARVQMKLQVTKLAQIFLEALFSKIFRFVYFKV